MAARFTPGRVGGILALTGIEEGKLGLELYATLLDGGATSCIALLPPPPLLTLSDCGKYPPPTPTAPPPPKPTGGAANTLGSTLLLI